VDGWGLNGIWGSAGNDVWEVGYRNQTGSMFHWTSGFPGGPGTPYGVAGTDFLYAVWGSGSGDVWVAGTSGAFGAAAHFNGTALAAASCHGTANLSGVWGTRADDVWMVGSNGSQGVAVHFTSPWPTDATPSPSIVPIDGTSLLEGVWASAHNDVWAVGYNAAGATIVRWNGVAWSQMMTFGGATSGLVGIWGVSE